VGMERVFLGSMQRRRPAPHARPDAAGVRQAGQHPRAGTGTGGIGSRAGGFAARGPCRVHQLPASSQPAPSSPRPSVLQRASSNLLQHLAPKAPSLQPTRARQCAALTRLRRPCSRRRRPRADARHGVRTRQCRWVDDCWRCMPAAIRYASSGTAAGEAGETGGTGSAADDNSPCMRVPVRCATCPGSQ
jgi:hypothetical protein